MFFFNVLVAMLDNATRGCPGAVACSGAGKHFLVARELFRRL